MSPLALRERLEPWLGTESSSLDLAQLLTFVLFIYYAGEPGFPFMVWAPISVAVLIAGLIWPRLRRSRLLWLYLTIAIVWARLPELAVMDNHHYLIAYWSIAVTTCLFVDSRHPAPLVARNARSCALVSSSMASSSNFFCLRVGASRRSRNWCCAFRPRISRRINEPSPSC